MGGRIHRERLRANARMLNARFGLQKRYCPNCKELLTTNGHYIHVSRWEGFPEGVSGIWTCEKIAEK